MLFLKGEPSVLYWRAELETELHERLFCSRFIFRISLAISVELELKRSALLSNLSTLVTYAPCKDWRSGVG